MTQTTTTERDHRMEFVPSAKWVRVFVGGEAIADSKRTRLLREGRPPVYYFPTEDVRMDLLEGAGHTDNIPHKGDATYWNLKMGDRVIKDAAWTFEDPPREASFLKGQVAFAWEKMDAWFEENEEVFVHARDPYKRIDVVLSTRHVKGVVGGETVAETDNPMLLFETGLPVRYYIPKLDVRMGLFQSSDRVTRCPYKGEAHYYSVDAGGDITENIA